MNVSIALYLSGMKKTLILCIQIPTSRIASLTGKQVPFIEKTTLVIMFVIIPYIAVLLALILQLSSGLEANEWLSIIDKLIVPMLEKGGVHGPC